VTARKVHLLFSPTPARQQRARRENPVPALFEVIRCIAGRPKVSGSATIPRGLFELMHISHHDILFNWSRH